MQKTLKRGQAQASQGSDSFNIFSTMKEVQIPKVVKAHRINDLFPEDDNTSNNLDNKENKQDTLKKESTKKEEKVKQQSSKQKRALVTSRESLSKLYGLDQMKRQVSPSLLLDNFMMDKS